MDPNAYLKQMVPTTPHTHKMAAAFLAWLRDDDLAPLTAIAERHGFKVSSDGGLLVWKQGRSAIFYMAMLRDIASAREITDLLTSAHERDRLPLLIVQYSNDPTDRRGANVFDIYSSTRELAITHANRVYTKKTRR